MHSLGLVEVDWEVNYWGKFGFESWSPSCSVGFRLSLEPDTHAGVSGRWPLLVDAAVWVARPLGSCYLVAYLDALSCGSVHCQVSLVTKQFIFHFVATNLRSVSRVLCCCCLLQHFVLL